MNSLEHADSSPNVIGIVTVLFNSDGVLPDFFASLARQRNVRYRLYVIDNSKTDSGSQLATQLVKQHGIDAIVVFNNANAGVAKGNNQGVKLALRDGCNWVLLANNDIVFDDEDLLANMLAFSMSGMVDAVVPKIYYFAEGNRIWCAGGRFSVLKGTNPHIGYGEIDRGQFDNVARIDYAPTCFMLLRSEVFKTVGMMDERYFVYYDDSDFVWRMKKSGLSLFYWPDGRIWHKVSFSTGGEESPFSIYYSNRNRIYFIKKNFDMMHAGISLTYFCITRVVRYLGLSQEKKSSLVKAVRDGFKMHV